MKKARNTKKLAKMFTGTFVLLTALAGIAFLGTCKNDASPSTKKSSLTIPVLTLTPRDGALRATWTPSSPAADSYDVYCAPGKVTAEKIKNASGVKIHRKQKSGFNIPGLTNGTQYSVMVMAKKTGYSSVNSLAKQARPDSKGGSGEEPGGNIDPNDIDDPDQANFDTPPVLTLAPLNESIQCNWTPSSPSAYSYNLYWREGSFTETADVKAGTKVEDASNGQSITGLTNGTLYSVVVTGVREGYNNITSEIRTAAPAPLSLTAPSLSVISSDKSLKYTWSATNPAADSYDVYWKQGSITNVADVKTGTKITGATSGGTINNLTNGTDYSVVVVANKAGYTSADSTVRTRKPSVAPVRAANFKRGICYGPGEQLNNHAQNFAALSPALSWIYTWGVSATVGNGTNGLQAALTANDVAFVPMTWGSNWNENDLRAYLTAHPEVEFLLAYNEPMFTNEANMTPARAAQDWPRLKKIAQDFNLKLVSPALNFGQMMGPKAWFEQFIAQPQVSLDDIHAIALHCYMGSPGAIKEFVSDDRVPSEAFGYRRYNKPIWVTEFCAWGDGETWFPKGGESGKAVQERYMSEVLIYFEQEPLVERYAWFMANGGANNGGLNNWPFFNFVQSNGLSRLGQIFVNMSFCDKTVWEPAGATIAAAQFTANHLSLFTTATNAGNSGWPGNNYGSYPGLQNQDNPVVNNNNNAGTSVHFRPTTDNGANVQPLDVYNFNGNMKWMEYQVNLPAAKNYTLTLRYQTVLASNIQIYVDNMNAEKATVALNSTGWNTQTVDLGNIAAGNHTIRLKANGGNCTLNWLKVD